ncbi:MAG: helix-turn-helix transcriptional regulator [Rhizomicrobium sp.]
MRNNVAINQPHPLDVALGGRIRLRRRELEMSQDQLARKIGITFQQVQKYEHGTNRVSFSRLAEIAGALKCSVSDLMGRFGPDESGSQVLAACRPVECARGGGAIGCLCVDQIDQASKGHSRSCSAAS